MKYTETVHIGPVCYAHQLRLNYASPCNRLHGHNAEVEVVVAGTKLNRAGMLVDFTHIKDGVRRYDHATIGKIFDDDGTECLFQNQFESIEPSTAENLAGHLFSELEHVVSALNPSAYVVSVSIWETPSSKVTVTKE